MKISKIVGVMSAVTATAAMFAAGAASACDAYGNGCYGYQAQTYTQPQSRMYTSQQVGSQRYTVGSDGSSYTTQYVGKQAYTYGQQGGRQVMCSTQYVGNQAYTYCN